MRRAQRALLLLLVALGLTLGTPTAQAAPVHAAIAAAHLDQATLPGRVHDLRAGRVDPGHPPHSAVLPALPVVVDRLVSAAVRDAVQVRPHTIRTTRTSRGPPRG